MALWNEKNAPGTPGATASPSPSPERPAAERPPADPTLAVSPRRPTPNTPTTSAAPRAASEPGESVIAANLTIEGKIEGSGNVRMAGRFKGDVRIDGNFSMDPGAHLTGQVLASIVVVGGELQGNIESAKRVDVLEGGVIVGDVKAGSITVAAGSRMRGHVEFGWEDEKVKVKPGLVSSGS
jgi:cytoskeletal protein CcmA (bactofilin family)